MTVDIAKTLFRTPAAEGVVLSNGTPGTLQARYVRPAEYKITCNYAGARINGVNFDRHAEGNVGHSLVRGLRMAAASYLADRLGSPLIPNWNGGVAPIPDIFACLCDAAVGIDNS